MQHGWIAFCLVMCLVLCAAHAAAGEGDLYVKAVDGLPEDFLFGMDVSSVIALENAGVRYRDASGAERDLFALLRENGIGWIRVRVWVNPYDDKGHGFGGGNSDLKTAAEIGRRAAAADQRLLVDFHYSDFWADPAKQMAPRAWAGMDVNGKADALYRYTRDALEILEAAGADVGMVQLGNETNGRMCGESDWTDICRLMNAGARAVRENMPEARICVHFTNPENGAALREWALILKNQRVDYDVFATSYYPFWHGTLDNLRRVLTELRAVTGKAVMVAETSYPWTLEDGDFSGNSVSEGSTGLDWPVSVQGQANAVRDITDTVVRAGGIGVFYWEGAWVPTGGRTWEENHVLWETYGTGWASSYAGVYDPEDAGRYYGGCACDNQAMFDFSARALASLSVFRLMRGGSAAAVVPVEVKNVSVTVRVGEPLVLPETAEAVMTDNSRAAVAVAWDPEILENIDTRREGAYTVPGTAAGLPVRCAVTVSAYNWLRNGDFESADDSMWRAVDLGRTAELYREEKAVDSKDGKGHWHFYSASADSVRFTLEQDVQDVPAGTYRYEISVMGGDCGRQDVYSYVLVNGVEAARCATGFTKWNEWHTAVIDGITVREGDTVTVGLYVECAGAGAWGKIDAAAFK